MLCFVLYVKVLLPDGFAAGCPGWVLPAVCVDDEYSLLGIGSVVSLLLPGCVMGDGRWMGF